MAGMTVLTQLSLGAWSVIVQGSFWLTAALISFAREKGFEPLVLDTPKNTERAHKFYLKAGIEHIAYEDLPLACRPPYPVEMCDFFVLHLKHD